MEHLAIMRKSWGLLPKILSGEKIIESRWYKNKYSPWDKIKKGDAVYFKNSGGPVSVMADVSDVLQFTNLTPDKVGELLKKYGSRDGIPKEKIKSYYEIFKDKNYCLLVFIKNPKRIKPFQINKRGFGIMSAWIAAESISKLT